MGRSRTLVILAGLLFAGLCLPAAALAGTYSWDLPANFTTTAPGANPDHDAYGATPWSYVDAAATGLPGLPPTSTPSAFRQLDTFLVGGGLAQWNDSSDSNALVALNLSGSAVGEIPAGQLAMRPAQDRAVAIGWTSPLPHTQSVSVVGSFTALKSCSGTGPSWTLEQNGVAIASGSSAIPASYVSLPAGKTELIRRPMRADVARSLRRVRSVRLRVSTNLTSVPRSSVVRTLGFSR